MVVNNCVAYTGPKHVLGLDFIRFVWEEYDYFANVPLMEFSSLFSMWAALPTLPDPRYSLQGVQMGSL